MAQRYGRRPARPWWRRPAPLAAAALGTAAALAFLVWSALATSVGRPEPTTIAYQVLDDSSVQVRYALRRDPGDAVRCTLQALDAAHAEVGVLEEDFPAGGEALLESTAVVRTIGRPVTALVRSCTVLQP